MSPQGDAAPAAPTRPLPRPSPLSRPFWEAAARHELVVQRCQRCGTHLFYPRANCPCGSTELAWVAVSGRATVHAFTVARRPTHPGLADRVPYVIAIVELEEGPRMTTNVVGCPVEEVRVGLPVQAGFEDVADGVALVVFRPRA